jgi:hypothetical protein
MVSLIYDEIGRVYFLPYDLTRIDGIFYSVDESEGSEVAEIERLNTTVFYTLEQVNKCISKKRIRWADDLGIFHLHVQGDELHVQWHTFVEYQKYSSAIQNAWQKVGRVRGKHCFLRSPETISWGADA